MRGFWRLTWVELKLFLREPMLAFLTLLFPLMMLLIFGAVYGNEPSDFFGGRGMVDVSVPAWTGLIIATTGFLSLAINVSTYRERGILRRFRLTPLRPHAILGAQIAVLLFMTGLGMCLLMLAGRLVFGLRFEGNPLSVAAAFALGSLSIFSIGFLLAGTAPTARTAQAVGMIIFYPMIFLSGATIPLEQMTGPIRRWASVLPLTHVVRLLRGLWVGEPWSRHLPEVAILSAILIVGVTLSAWLFRWE